MSATDDFKAAIMTVLGCAPEMIVPGRLHRFGTNGRRGDLAGWCKLFDDQRGGVFGCFRQGVRESWSAAKSTTLNTQQRLRLARQVMNATIERQVEKHQQWSQNAQRIEKLWVQCVPLVPGDPVTLYLKRRGFGDLWPYPACLRLHCALPYWHGGEKLGTYPAMVAPLVARDARTVALHRTYLCSDGRKADLPVVKKLTPAAGRLAGACVPLFGLRHACIGIAEGIETALAASCASSVPTVAAYSAGNLGAWRWPPEVRRIVIFADADTVGANAAERLSWRARRAGLTASVIAPSATGFDWCDVWALRTVTVTASEASA